MIAQLRGTLVEKGYDHVVVDVGGVGYRVTVSLQTLAALPAEGLTARLLTYLQVREDALTLFGFYTDEERTAFELCMSVQGIGPKMAMAILSSLAPSELAQAIKAEDVPRLKRVPGVGMKTAERMVLELRDKLDKAGLGPRAAGDKPVVAKPEDKLAAQVASALANLGYKPAEALKAAETTVKEHAQLPFPDLLKRALRALAE
jgi:Holliday junction DNA helicase RuvA